MTSMRSAVLLGVACILALSTQPPRACAGPNGQAKDAYSKGDFAGCIGILVQELRKKPDHQDNIELMDQALPLYINQVQSGAKAATAGQNWDSAVQHYDQLTRLGAELAALPPVQKGRDKKSRQSFLYSTLVPDVTVDRKAAADKAAEAHYQAGTKYETGGNMRGAAIEFRQAQSFVRPYKDAADRYDACRKKGIVKVCVMPFEDKAGKSYGALGDILTGKVLSVAMDSNPEFIEFITRENLDAIMSEQNVGQSGTIDPTTAAKVGKIAGVQAFVFGKVNTVMENFPPQTEKTGQNSTSYDTKAGKVVKNCIYTVYERVGKVEVRAEMRVVDVATARVTTQEQAAQVEEDGTSWVTFRGDEEAIPDEVRELNKGERALRTGQELTMDALDKLGARFAGKLTAAF